MKNYSVILIALLIGITIFSVFKYASYLKEKYDLLNTLNSIKDQVAAKEFEKQNLLQELEKEKELAQQLREKNLVFKANLRASKKKITKLNADFVQTQQAGEQLNSEIAALKDENATLKKEEDGLKTQLNEVTQEKDNLRARLSSIAELKKAIKELKKQMRKVSRDLKQKVKNEEITEGNRGFLIKDGRSTCSARVKIEVVPAPKNE